MKKDELFYVAKQAGADVIDGRIVTQFGKTDVTELPGGVLFLNHDLGMTVFIDDAKFKTKDNGIKEILFSYKGEPSGSIVIQYPF